MQHSRLGLLRSPRDVSSTCTCPRATWLALQELDGTAPTRPPLGGATVVAMRNGNQHEDRVRAALEARLGPSVASAHPHPEAAHDETVRLMEAGQALIRQAGLLDDEVLVFGYADFLCRVEQPSALGAWSYAVVEAKWAKQPSEHHVAQLGFYSSVVARIQGHDPAAAVWARHELVDLDPVRWRAVWDAALAAVVPAPDGPGYPAACRHCSECAWQPSCAAERLAAHDVTAVAGIGPSVATQLAGAGVYTVEDLAHCEPGKLTTPRRVEAADALARSLAAGETYVRVRGAAGFALLAEPSPGDLYLDFENIELPSGERLEYLAGLLGPDGNFTPVWATDTCAEAGLLARLVSVVETARAEHPNMHLYHFGNYERQGLAGLVARHGDPGATVTGWLDSGLLVDLEQVAKRSLLVGAPGSGLKTLEKLCGFSRQGAVAAASDSMLEFYDWLTDADPARLERLEQYNHEDVLATEALCSWLRALAARYAEGTLPVEWYGRLRR